MKELRRTFCEHHPKIDAGRGFFIDEIGPAVAMARDYAPAPCGERVGDYMPRNHGDVVTIIGALTVNGLTAMLTVRDGTTKEVLRAHSTQVLAPELPEGDVVILDDLAAHKDPEVLEIVEGRGAMLYVLPP